MGLTRSNGYLTQWVLFKLDPSILGRVWFSSVKCPLDIGSPRVQNHLRPLLLLYASKPPSAIRTAANSHRCDTLLQLVSRSLVFVSLRQPRGESSTGLHSSVGIHEDLPCPYSTSQNAKSIRTVTGAPQQLKSAKPRAH